MADAQGLDLVEISPNAAPPVCKIIDYKKFLYEQKKRDKILKAKTTQVTVKEIRFGPQTDEHDYEFRSEEHTSELQSRPHLVYRLLLEKKKKKKNNNTKKKKTTKKKKKNNK